MKKILISIPFVILVALDIIWIVTVSDYLFGALGILHYSFINPSIELVGAFCFPIGPALLATYFYSRLLRRNQVNVIIPCAWTLLIFGALQMLAYMPSEILDRYSPGIFRFGRFILSSAFTGTGFIGLIYPRIKRSLASKRQNDSSNSEDVN